MSNSNLPKSNSTIKICSVEGCEGNVRSRTLCQKHYTRFIRYGRLHAVKPAQGFGYKNHDKTPEELFWSRVDKTSNPGGCWEWKAYTKLGYGRTCFNGKNVHAHRLSWCFTYGAMPELSLLHSCDNRRCVNPDHLREGSQLENMQDMAAKDRQAKGEKHGMSKLTTESVINIKFLLTQGSSCQSIGDRYGVTAGAIYAIKKGYSWKYI